MPHEGKVFNFLAPDFQICLRSRPFLLPAEEVSFHKYKINPSLQPCQWSFPCLRPKLCHSPSYTGSSSNGPFVSEPGLEVILDSFLSSYQVQCIPHPKSLSTVSCYLFSLSPPSLIMSPTVTAWLVSWPPSLLLIHLHLYLPIILSKCYSDILLPQFYCPWNKIQTP